jgi:hypothetical protein
MQILVSRQIRRQRYIIWNLRLLADNGCPTALNNFTLSFD